MADTGEDREIRRRADANEAEAIRESKKLVEKTKQRSAKGLHAAGGKEAAGPSLEAEIDLRHLCSLNQYKVPGGRHMSAYSCS